MVSNVFHFGCRFSFPPPYVEQKDSSISWLYDELDTLWRRWLPASVSHTIRRGAFYSVLVRPGFRIISLNMNYCNNKNWWLLLNSTDPATELQWFIYELQSAEFSNEKVHVSIDNFVHYVYMEIV